MLCLIKVSQILKKYLFRGVGVLVGLLFPVTTVLMPIKKCNSISPKVMVLLQKKQKNNLIELYPSYDLQPALEDDRGTF